RGPARVHGGGRAGRARARPALSPRPRPHHHSRRAPRAGRDDEDRHEPRAGRPDGRLRRGGGPRREGRDRPRAGGRGVAPERPPAEPQVRRSLMGLPTYGTMGVDWEERVSFDRLRRERLARLTAELARSELGALLCFDMYNIRYVTSTTIGEWARDKLSRF